MIEVAIIISIVLAIYCYNMKKKKEINNLN